MACESRGGRLNVCMLAYCMFFWSVIYLNIYAAISTRVSGTLNAVVNRRSGSV